MSTVKKIIHSKFMHIFIAINCNLLHKYGHRKRLHRLWNHVLLLLYAAVKVVGGVNELYMLSTCQKCNNKAYGWGTSHTHRQIIFGFTWYLTSLSSIFVWQRISLNEVVIFTYIPLGFYFKGPTRTLIHLKCIWNMQQSPPLRRWTLKRGFAIIIVFPYLYEFKIVNLKTHYN